MATHPSRARREHDESTGVAAWTARVLVSEPVLLVSLVFALARMGASAIPLLGIVLQAAIWLGAYRYAYELTHIGSQGRRRPAEIIGLVLPGLDTRNLWLQTALVACVVLAARTFDDAVIVAVVLAVGLAQPGMLVALTVNQNLAAAMAPQAWLRVARRIGWAYLPIAALFAGVAWGQVRARELVPGFQLEQLAPIGWYYFWLHALLFAAYAAVGRAVWLKRHALGFEPEPLEDLVVPTDREEARSMAALPIDDAAARAGLEDAIARGAAPDLHARYRDVLRRQRDQAALATHGATYVAALLELREHTRALALADECLAIDPQWMPVEPATTVTLFDLAASRHATALAVRLVTNLARRAPRTPDLPAMVIRAAPWIIDRLDDTALCGELIAIALARACDDDTRQALEALRARLP
jgi:hypothetical protein